VQLFNRSKVCRHERDYVFRKGDLLQTSTVPAIRLPWLSCKPGIRLAGSRDYS
jgi:hypothetical protein